MVDFVIRIIADPTGVRRGGASARRELRRTEQAADRVGRSIRRAFQFIGGALLLRRTGQFIDQFATLQNQIRVVSQSNDQLNTSLNQLFQIANRTRTPVGALGTLFQRASIASSELGASQEQLFTFVERVGQALAVQGSTTASARGALIQLSQAIGSTVVRAEEFNSIQEGALPILQAVARGLDEAGGSVARLRTLVINGEVTNREFFEAFLTGSGQLGEQFAATRSTIGQALTRLNNAFVQTVGRTSQTTGALRALVGIINQLAAAVRSDIFRGALNILFDGFTRISTATGQLVEFLKDPTLQKFLGIGQTLIDGVAQPPESEPPGLPPGGRAPSDELSADLQKQLDQAKELSNELELQNQLIFAQLSGDAERTRELERQLAVESAISKELREARPEVARAIERQIEEQQELNAALERGRQIQEDFRTVTQDAFETLIDGARRGKLSFDDLLNSILSNLIRIQTNRAFDALFGSGPGSSGALGGNFTNLLGGGGTSSGGFNPFSLLGLQGGGTIDVLGRGGTDRNTLSINGRDVARVNRGETIGVVPAGAAAASGPTTIVNVTNNSDVQATESRRTGPSGEEIVDIVIGSPKFGRAVDDRTRSGVSGPIL